MLIKLLRASARPVCLLVVPLFLGLASCGTAPEVDSGGENSILPPSTNGTSDATSGEFSEPMEQPVWMPPPPELRAVFERLQGQNLGFTLLFPTELPPGTSMAESWRALDQEPGKAPPGANPHVVGPDGQKELRLLLRTGSGWIEILQGMRGDLGDLPHQSIDLDETTAAGVYKVMGGDLVQWGREDNWYAVFAQGHVAADVIRLARRMEPLP